MKILISPFSKTMRNGKENPKNYPYWEEVVRLLQEKGHEVIQLKYGNEKDVPECKSIMSYSSVKVAETILDTADTFICVDNFLQHLAHYKGKRGVVIWGKSDPLLFGYAENVNLLKDRKFLRNHQFEAWDAEEFDAKVFVDPQIVVDSVEKIGVLKK